MQVGHDFEVEIRDVKWNHVSASNELPALGRSGLVAEIRRRCPGFTDVQQYNQGIGNGQLCACREDIAHVRNGTPTNKKGKVCDQNTVQLHAVAAP